MLLREKDAVDIPAYRQACGGGALFQRPLLASREPDRHLLVARHFLVCARRAFRSPCAVALPAASIPLPPHSPCRKDNQCYDNPPDYAPENKP